MEHPGINISDIKKKMTLEEVQGKISDLNSRMSFAHQMYNQDLIYQLQLALNAYNRAYQEMLDDQYGNDNSGQIDIS